MDYGARIADEAIEQTAKQIRGIYRKAAAELKKKLADFVKRHDEKQKEMFRKLEAGEIAKSAYDSWMTGQVFIGDRWKEKVDQAVRIMQDANKQAALLIRRNKLNVFAENYNYEAFLLEKKTNGGISFALFNDRSVERLLKQKPKMLPEWRIDEEKDYIWNEKKVQNTVTQGIIQGRKISEISDDLTQTLCAANDSKMRTFARTAMTGAQNAGRQTQMEDAEDMGIKVRKKWVATLDNRTRDTHQELDGQVVDADEPFEVDGMEIMYPGDPNAEPELVYNCRCTMVEVYEGIDRKTVRRAYYDEDDEEYDEKHRKSYTVEDMTYKEWKKWKEGRK